MNPVNPRAGSSNDVTPLNSVPQSVMQSNLASLNTSQVMVDEERVEIME